MLYPALAQLGGPQFVPPALAAPPVLERWFLESPWLPAIALAAVAALVFFILRSRGEGRRAVLGAAAPLLLATAMIVLSMLITTEREKLAARTEELISATAAADLDRLAPMLAEDVALSLLGSTRDETKSGILGLVQKYPGGMFPVEEHSVHEITAQVDRAGGGKTLCRARVVVQGVPNGSWWRIGWRKNAAGEWTAVHIEALHIGYVSSGDLPR